MLYSFYVKMRRMHELFKNLPICYPKLLCHVNEQSFEISHKKACPRIWSKINSSLFRLSTLKISRVLNQLLDYHNSDFLWKKSTAPLKHVNHCLPITFQITEFTLYQASDRATKKRIINSKGCNTTLMVSLADVSSI